MSAEKTVIHNPHPGTNTKVGIRKILMHSKSNTIILTLEGWGLVLQRNPMVEWGSKNYTSWLPIRKYPKLKTMVS